MRPTPLPTRRPPAGSSSPVTEIPAHWPEAYRAVVQARNDLIEADKDNRLIERPEQERRWSTEPWEKREAAALRNWLLDAAEREELWFEERDGFTVPRPSRSTGSPTPCATTRTSRPWPSSTPTDHLGKRDASLATTATQADALVGMIRDRAENGGWAKEEPPFRTAAHRPARGAAQGPPAGPARVRGFPRRP
ncbi:DUF7008 domain-containing protein [Streptomyces sp. Li-HN-5-11]|uniref:DUF7008 domain-containing protein n=1 Tax=Streptomyces sp. Li-HN-5-11 TaxID=3075432 RepID=UPI0037DA0145